MCKTSKSNKVDVDLSCSSAPLLSRMAILYLVNDWLYESQTGFLFLTVQTKACKVNN